jgi:N-acyl-D-aspartate/D-glutamate deacylase
MAAMVRGALGLLSLASTGLLGQTSQFDLLITGARVIDGSGGSWYYADIGIRGDTIAAVGPLAGADASVRIDGRGLVAAPGFIDIHSHGRRGIFAVPTAENYLREGVTTIVEGPDGSSPVPLAPFLDKVRQTPISINFATMVGQGSIRELVIGLANRKATPEEIEKMKGLVAQATRDGAFGLSTGLFYVPGNYTPTEEVIELAKVVGRMGGIHISHMRRRIGKKELNHGETTDREDEYLERRFGQAYLDYRARVNEVIPLPRFWR